MSEFRTEVNPVPFDEKIGLESNIFSVGSCFAENIGNRFLKHKQSITVNPFGIIYNPLSICSLLSKSLGGHSVDQDGYINRDDSWYHTEMHSKVTASSQPELEKWIRNIALDTKKSIESANWILITLGTAVVYETVSDKKLVANCHKMPSKNFSKRILQTTEIVTAFEKTIDLIQSVNPAVKFIFTVSPVRHVKDTIQVNSISKSTLLLAIYHLKEKYQSINYFPAYEIMMDDLRDYRFYSDDMLHPSEKAQEYIWQKLKATCFTSELISFISKWDKISKSLRHKPFNSHSEKHQSFLRKLLAELENLNSKVDVTNEIADIKAQIL